jgi:secreted trypsin-like serine protease
MFENIEALIGRSVREVEEGEFPNVVCIARYSIHPNLLQYNIKCTGTLVSRDHILTSDHCFQNMGLRSLYVLVGSRDLRQTTRHYIYWWLTFNNWASTQDMEIEFDTNDIAIIKVN